MIVCGHGGCNKVSYPPGVIEAVGRRRMAWAKAYRAEHGEFPDTEMQLDYLVTAMEEERQAAHRRAKMRRDR
jgi:hypothetical protein